MIELAFRIMELINDDKYLLTVGYYGKSIILTVVEGHKDHALDLLKTHKIKGVIVNELRT